MAAAVSGAPLPVLQRSLAQLRAARPANDDEARRFVDDLCDYHPPGNELHVRGVAQSARCLLAVAAGDKRRALKLAAHAAKKFAADERARNATIRFAAENGASLREIASGTGLTHMSVKRILERTPAEQT